MSMIPLNRAKATWEAVYADLMADALDAVIVAAIAFGGAHDPERPPSDAKAGSRQAKRLLKSAIEIYTLWRENIEWGLDYLPEEPLRGLLRASIDAGHAALNYNDEQREMASVKLFDAAWAYYQAIKQR